MSFRNPYKKLEEIKEKIHELEVKIAGEKNLKQKKEYETEEMFLVFEMIPIESSIKYFEDKIKKMEVKNEKSIWSAYRRS